MTNGYENYYVTDHLSISVVSKILVKADDHYIHLALSIQGTNTELTPFYPFPIHHIFSLKLRQRLYPDRTGNSLCPISPLLTIISHAIPTQFLVFLPCALSTDGPQRLTSPPDLQNSYHRKSGNQRETPANGHAYNSPAVTNRKTLLNLCCCFSQSTLPLVRFTTTRTL